MRAVLCKEQVVNAGRMIVIIVFDLCVNLWSAWKSRQRRAAIAARSSVLLDVQTVGLGPRIGAHSDEVMHSTSRHYGTNDASDDLRRPVEAADEQQLYDDVYRHEGLALGLGLGQRPCSGCIGGIGAAADLSNRGAHCDPGNQIKALRGEGSISKFYDRPSSGGKKLCNNLKHCVEKRFRAAQVHCAGNGAHTGRERNDAPRPNNDEVVVPQSLHPDDGAERY